MQRHLGHGIHAEKPNRVLHFDSCFNSKRKLGLTYILTLKDDLSSYVWLVLCHAADAEATKEDLIK